MFLWIFNQISCNVAEVAKVTNSTQIREVVLKTRIGAFGFAQHTDIGTLSCFFSMKCPVIVLLK